MPLLDRLSDRFQKLKGPKSEDPYDILREYDTVFLIDDSGSMRGRLWSQVSTTLSDIAPECTKRDKDGIDIYFINKPDQKSFRHITSAKKVTKIFDKVQPGGLTATGKRLHDILDPYVTRYEEHHKIKAEPPKPINVIVITDGRPTDDPYRMPKGVSTVLEYNLARLAKRLDEVDAPLKQVGVQFCQIGDDEEAATFLKNLDDDLKQTHKCRDMVDTVSYSERGEGGAFNKELVMKTLLGSIIARMDRKVLTKN